MSERQSQQDLKDPLAEYHEEKHERTEVVQRSVQLLPTGINVKMWSRYGEAAIKGELIYVLQVGAVERVGWDDLLVFTARADSLRTSF